MINLKQGERIDDLNRDGYKIIQSKDKFCFGMDAVLLSGFAEAKSGEKVDDSVVFKQAYIGNNSTIKNCIILNDVYIGDNVHLENCIVESHGTIKPNTEIINHESEPKIIIERNFRYGL